MRCTGTKKDGSVCKNRAVVVVGGTAVCEYHIHQARKLWFNVVNDLSPDIAISALADQRYLIPDYTFSWYQGNVFV